MLDHQLLIIYPAGSDHTSYQELARRLFTACKEELLEVALCSSRELRNMTTEQLSNATLAVVNPIECAATSSDRSDFFSSATSSDRSDFFSKLSLARKRVMVLAEAVVESTRGPQSRLPVSFDAIFEVGFVPRKDENPLPDVPYHFVFNGPTKEEEQIIAELSPSQERYIPWAVVGPQDPYHLNLLAELMDYKLYRGGLCFLEPPLQQGKGKGKRKGLLSSSGLAAVLSKTNYCVWGSNDSCAYYESFRFIQALLVGAVPCKIDGNRSWEESDIPGIFPSVQSFYARVQEEDHWSTYCSAREFYTSKGPLAEHLEKALRLV
jgi:hypothetical protein